MKKHMLMTVMLGAICAVTAVAGDGKIVVQKAVYGVPGDENQSRDVTAEVRALIGENLSLPVSDIAIGGDPAPGVVKTLRVEHVINGETLTASGTDGQFMFLGKPKLAIKKAAYGVLNDPARTRDVTAKIQKLVSGEPLSLKVGDLAAGDDPALGVVKTLWVEYVADGKSLTASGTDPETITLGATLAK